MRVKFIPLVLLCAFLPCNSYQGQFNMKNMAGQSRRTLSKLSQLNLLATDVDMADELPQWIQTTNRLTVDAIKVALSLLISEERPYARFYALETIARVPYFSYTSVLHLYETFGCKPINLFSN
jgi:hypothetical protein